MNKKKRKDRKQPANVTKPVAACTDPQPRAGSVRLAADDANLSAMAEYKRKDEAELILPEASIPTELDSSSKLKARRSYYLQWLVPDPTNSRGALLSLDKFKVLMKNEGLFDVNIVVQQPHGHEPAPNSIAAWVLHANKTIKAGDLLEMDIHPVDNNVVVPLRTDVGGADCVCFAAFSAARQGLSSAGAEVPKEEVGLRITVSALYKASGNVLQGGKFFALRSVDNDDAMFVVDPKPPIPILVRDIAPEGHRLVPASFATGGKDVLSPALMDKKLGSIPSNKWAGLSNKHVYRLPAPWAGLADDGYGKLGLYIRSIAVGDHSSWVVVNSPTGTNAIRAGDGKYAPLKENNVSFSSDCQLVPMQSDGFNRIPVKTKTRSGRQLELPIAGAHQLERVGGWRDDFVNTVSFIVGVVKVAAAVAGAVGLLERNVIGGSIESIVDLDG